jgi:orotidine 5'-phosphate decarboxylase subfamily 2
MDFFSRMEDIVRGKGTSLCVGLDPRMEHPGRDPASSIVRANRRIIEATAPFAACYKPNIAFYEAHGPRGLEALEETLALIPDDIPVIVDAKRCDIDATAEAYAASIFGRLGADAVTLSPYMGEETVLPFLRYEGRGLFLLCRTSNPGAGVFQDLQIPAASLEASAEPLFLRVARTCSSWSDSIGLVVAGNDCAGLRAVREALPRAWFLAPGIGAQGGGAEEAFAAGAREDGFGILVVAARSVAEAADTRRADTRRLRSLLQRSRIRLRSRRRRKRPFSRP